MLEPGYAFADATVSAYPMLSSPDEPPLESCALGSEVLTTLAESGALDALADSRRSAIWDVRGFVRTRTLPLPLAHVAQTPSFTPLPRHALVNWDYRTSGHSTRGYPLEALREVLRAHGLPDAAEIRDKRDGERASYAGLVICRQRPSTAKGVVFMTLEDETGFVNVVLWEKIFLRYPLLAKTAMFLGVSGRIQSQDGVIHLVASKLWVPPVEPPIPSLASRDFH
jgi:error-prone DNA polymerase